MSCWLSCALDIGHLSIFRHVLRLLRNTMFTNTDKKTAFNSTTKVHSNLSCISKQDKLESWDIFLHVTAHACGDQGIEAKFWLSSNTAQLSRENILHKEAYIFSVSKIAAGSRVTTCRLASFIQATVRSHRLQSDKRQQQPSCKLHNSHVSFKAKCFCIVSKVLIFLMENLMKEWMSCVRNSLLLLNPARRGVGTPISRTGKNLGFERGLNPPDIPPDFDIGSQGGAQPDIRMKSSAQSARQRAPRETRVKGQNMHALPCLADSKKVLPK